MVLVWAVDAPTARFEYCFKFVDLQQDGLLGPGLKRKNLENFEIYELSSIIKTSNIVVSSQRFDLPHSRHNLIPHSNLGDTD